ncbi:MAG TPA: S-layer homology domain-containing protein [Candidatus Galloscillospira excrementipullorum]|nr:S-layer homology domain-containing protein [Candidatus Galloscillospira excrementipullorum]
MNPGCGEKRRSIKGQRRVLAAFLAVCLLLSLTPVTALAEEDVLSSPDRYTDVSLEDAVAYLRGSGTQDDPFQIWNADDLYYINYLEYWRGQEEGEVPVYHYLQMADIDLSSADRFDKGTGYITANFAGVYDGGGHALTGMDKPLFYFTKGTYVGDGAGTVFTDYVSGESHDKVFSAIVRNLTLSEPAITQTVATDVIEQMGAVAAYAVNTAFYNIRVEGGEINGVSGAASIAGRAGSVVIDACSSNADIYASMHRAAGIVSNLRIVDDKKGATSTSLVTNCTFSGAVSGNLDGERGSAGIVGAVYMDGTSELDNGGGLPLYVSDCTFSGTVSGTVTSGSGNFGGILGTSYLGPGLNLKNNVVTGTIENISVQGAGTAANVGGIVGKTLNYSLLGRELTLVLENNDAGQAVLPDSNPGEKLYAGTLIGCQYDANRVITGPVSISTTESLGLYGNIQGAQFSGEIGALTLPECQGNVEFYILEGATVESLTVNTTGTLKIHNAGTLGNVTNKMGVTIADNTGTIENVTSLEGTVLVTGNQGEIGNLTSAGTITVGKKDVSEETGTAGNKEGNEGVLGDLSAAGSVTIYRNAQDAKIGGVTSQTGSVTIGQSDSSTEAVRDYNVNAGTIGSVTAATSVNIRSTAQGSVAAGEGELVKAGSSVAVGTATVQNANTVGDIEAGTSVSIYNAAQGSTGTVEAGTTVSIGTSALLNEGDIGSVTAGDSAGTTVTVYNGGAEIGDISAKSGSISIAANKDQIGAVDSALSSVAVGSNVKTQQNAGNAVGNEGTIESLTAGTSVTIYRNTGRVGALDAQTSVTIGQGNNASADVRAYNVNSGSIGSVAAGTTVGIYGGVTAGSVAAGGGELVKAGSSVTIGSLTYPNYNTIGPVEAPTVSGYTFATVGEVTADSNKLVNASGDTGTVLTASGNVTLSAQQDGSISDGENTYNPGLKLVLTATATVAFEGDCPVQLSSVESNGTVTLTDAKGVAKIGSINAVSEVKLGLSNESFAGTVTGDITAGSNVYVGYSGAYFTGKIGGSISGASSVTIYNSGTLGAAGKSISAGTGNLTLVNGKSTGHTGTVLSDVVNKGSTGTMSITNYGTPMAGKIEQKSSGLLTLTGTAASGRQYTGDISVARALSITGSIGENNEEDAVEVAFTGETAVISVSNQTVYLKVSGKQLQSVSVTSTATTAAKNTVDLRALSETVSVSFAGSKDNTDLLLPDAVQAGDVGTPVGATVVADVEGDTYATGNVTVKAGVSLSADGVLTLTATSPVLVNYGTIGAVNHTGTGTLTIYNVEADAKIGDVTSAGTITVGKKDVSEEMGAAGNKEGNEGVLGDLSAAGSVTIYRNAQGAEIGSVTSRTNNIIIGQSDSSNEAVRAYNTNAGTVGSVDAGLAVYVRSVTAGSVAAGEGELVKAGSSVAIGTTTVQNANTVGDIEAGTSVSIYNAAQGSTGTVKAGTTVAIGTSALLNKGGVGTVTAGDSTGTTVTVYNDGAQLGDISAKSGSISIAANKGQIGAVDSALSSVTVGSSGKTQQNAGNLVGNEGTIESLTAYTGVTVYRNAQDAEIGSVTSKTNNIIIGQSDSSDEAVRDYNANAGTVGSLDAGLAVYVRSVTAGSVATGEGELVKAGSSVTIGTASVQNANTVGKVEAGTGVNIYNAEEGSVGTVEAGSSVTIGSGTLFNGGDVESVAAKGTVTIYNGEDTEIGSVDTEAGVNIYGNEGTVGDVTAGTSIGVGDSGKTESTAAGRIGNTGEVGNLAAGTSVSIYCNTGTVGDIEAKTSSVTIGQSNNASADVQEHNVNSGSIGSVSAATSVAIHSSAQGSVAMQSGQSVSAGTSVAIGSEQNANANDIGPVQCQTTSSLYNGTGSVSSLTSGGTATVYVQEGSVDLNVITTDADVKIEDRTQSSAPSVNVTTGGGDVRVARAEGDTNPILAKVNLTVTEGLLEGQTLFVRGAFASLTHKGAGDVIMESADTSVANLIKLGTGDVKEFGETGSVTTPDEAQECLLSLVPVSHDSLEAYLLSAKGLPLDKGSWSNTQVEGGVFTPAAGIVAGGGTAEKLGTVAVETAQAGELEVTVSGTYTPEQGEGMLLTASLKVTIPALVERVDTVLLTSADEFEAAADQYAWQQTAQPQDYPVLAVMPVVSEAYSGVTPTANGQDVTEDGVLLVAVDAARALDEGVIEVQVAAQGENAPGYSQSVSYPLTEADRAKLDTQKEYYYITYRYMDGTTKDKTVPVEKGQTGETEAPGQREGYTFLGWRGDNDRLYSAGSEVTPEADMVMTAEWGADSTVYTLTISVTGGGSVVRVEDGQEHDIASGTGFLEGDQVVLRAKRATGYRFAGWTVDGESFDEEEITVTMDDNVTVKATFRRISSGGAPSGGSSGGSVTTYAIAVGSVENGTVECISKEAKGNEVLVTLTPDEGYEVGSLQVVKDSGGEVSVTKRGDGEYLFTMPGEAVRVIAAFVEAQEEADEWNNPFADVAAGAYYAGAVAWASANGIVTGYGDGTFGPDTAITREQLAAILYRYAQYLGLEVSQTADLTGYGDAADISEWAQQAFAWAVREGLISGMDDGTLAPQGTATRAQVATILMRLCEKLEG